jgi:hypothetical protein
MARIPRTDKPIRFIISPAHIDCRTNRVVEDKKP